MPDDFNGQPDIFVHDVLTGATERVSVGAADTRRTTPVPLRRSAATGRFVAFISWATNLVPLDTNKWCLAGFEGHWGLENCPDIFVRDRWAGTTERVSLSSSGEQAHGASYHGPAISRSGRFVAFPSLADNLVPGDTNGGTDIFVRDRETGRTSRVSVTDPGRPERLPRPVFSPVRVAPRD